MLLLKINGEIWLLFWDLIIDTFSKTMQCDYMSVAGGQDVTAMTINTYLEVSP